MSVSVKAGKIATGSPGGAMPGAGSFRQVPYGRPMGDPGLFGVLGDIGKGILGGIGGAATGLLTGGPLGAVGGAVRGITGALGVGGQRQSVTSSTPPLIKPMITPRIGTMGIQQQMPPPPTRNGRWEFDPPFGGAPGMYIGPAQTNGVAPKGMRLNKTSYFLRDGTFVPAGTKWVKIRRRNPLNPKALDRAMGRITSAKRASKKLSRVTIRKPASCK